MSFLLLVVLAVVLPQNLLFIVLIIIANNKLQSFIALLRARFGMRVSAFASLLHLALYHKAHNVIRRLYSRMCVLTAFPLLFQETAAT